MFIFKINNAHEYKDWLLPRVCSPSLTGPQGEIHVPLIWLTIKERDDKMLRDINLFIYSWVNTSYLLGLILSTSHRVETWSGLGVYEPKRQICATHKDCTCQHSEHSSSTWRAEICEEYWDFRSVKEPIDKADTNLQVPAVDTTRWQTTLTRPRKGRRYHEGGKQQAITCLFQNQPLRHWLRTTVLVR